MSRLASSRPSTSNSSAVITLILKSCVACLNFRSLTPVCFSRACFSKSLLLQYGSTKFQIAILMSPRIVSSSASLLMNLPMSWVILRFCLVRSCAEVAQDIGKFISKEAEELADVLGHLALLFGQELRGSRPVLSGVALVRSAVVGKSFETAIAVCFRRDVLIRAGRLRISLFQQALNVVFPSLWNPRPRVTRHQICFRLPNRTRGSI